MTKKARLSVISEEKTGMNLRFRDNRTGEDLTRTQVARKIDQGKILGYQHYRNGENRLVIRSIPDDSLTNNLN
jgi:Protein of unknown function (DUF3892)